MWKQLIYMNKVEPFFRVEIGLSEKSADISKIREKKLFFIMYLKPAKFLGKVIKFQVNTIKLSKVMPIFMWGGGDR